MCWWHHHCCDRLGHWTVCLQLAHVGLAGVSVPTVCRTNNGGCSHLCLVAPLPRGHTCACPTGVLMSADGMNCERGKSVIYYCPYTDYRVYLWCGHMYDNRCPKFCLFTNCCPCPCKSLHLTKLFVSVYVVLQGPFKYFPGSCIRQNSHNCQLQSNQCFTYWTMLTGTNLSVTEMSNFLIFTRRQDIRRISLEVEYYADVVVPTGKLKNAIAIDVDIVDGGSRRWFSFACTHCFSSGHKVGHHMQKPRCFLPKVKSNGISFLETRSRLE